jgi:hypothetical protein
LAKEKRCGPLSSQLSFASANEKSRVRALRRSTLQRESWTWLAIGYGSEKIVLPGEVNLATSMTHPFCEKSRWFYDQIKDRCIAIGSGAKVDMTHLILAFPPKPL